MYVSYSGLLLITFIVNLVFYKKIKKYSILTFMTHNEERRRK